MVQEYNQKTKQALEKFSLPFQNLFGTMKTFNGVYPRR